MGDFVKGKDFENYSLGIKNGILLHREIDSFTDTHDIIKQSKSRLKNKYKHYSGVIVDVFYDHYLAKNFSKFHDTPLEQFVDEHYNNLENHKHLLPSKAQGMIPYMIRGNWLVNYQHVRGIQKSLQGMSRRTKFDSRMDESIKELIEFDSLFAKEFLEFFPIIISHAEQFREELFNSQS